MSSEHEAAMEVVGAINALDDRDRALNKLFELPTLRDYFAAQAIVGCLGWKTKHGVAPDDIATQAYLIADAMLARSKVT